MVPLFHITPTFNLWAKPVGSTFSVHPEFDSFPIPLVQATIVQHRDYCSSLIGLLTGTLASPPALGSTTQELRHSFTSKYIILLFPHLTQSKVSTLTLHDGSFRPFLFLLIHWVSLLRHSGLLDVLQVTNSFPAQSFAFAILLAWTLCPQICVGLTPSPSQASTCYHLLNEKSSLTVLFYFLNLVIYLWLLESSLLPAGFL